MRKDGDANPDLTHLIDQMIREAAGSNTAIAS
jgi:hypothetical protein